MYRFAKRLKILKENAEPPIRAFNQVEPAGINDRKLMNLRMERQNAENTKVFWDNSDNNIGAEKKLWSERRRGEYFETRCGNHK